MNKKNKKMVCQYPWLIGKHDFFSCPIQVIVLATFFSACQYLAAIVS